MLQLEIAAWKLLVKSNRKLWIAVVSTAQGHLPN